MRKGWSLTLAVALAGVLGLSLGVQADPISEGQKVYLYDGIGAFPGGAFWVKTSPSGSNLFETFCMEYNEHFSIGTGYFVGSISGSAVFGGVPNGSDPLNVETAFLYYYFRVGLLDDLTNNGFQYNEAGYTALQQAIWFFEGEGGSTNLLTTLGSEHAGWSGIGNVRVMNLIEYDANGNVINRQSQLMLVPEASTIMLLGLGLITLGIVGRRRKLSGSL